MAGSPPINSQITSWDVPRATCGLSRVLFALEVNHFRGTSPVRCSSVEALTARCDSRGCPADAHLRAHAEGAGRISSTSLLQLAGVRGCRGPRTRSGTWDHRPPAAAGGRPGSMCWLPEACSSTPQPLRHRQPGVPCRRRPSTLLQASPTEKDLAGTLFDSWRRSLTR
jgi:hypothetical protein